MLRLVGDAMMRGSRGRGHRLNWLALVLLRCLLA